MKKRLAIIGLLLTLVPVGGAVAYWALTPTPGVTVENFKRLHEGMTEAEVEAIMGEPGEELQSPFSFFAGTQLWVRDDCEIQVRFDYTNLAKSERIKKAGRWKAMSGNCEIRGLPQLSLAQPPVPLLTRIRQLLRI